MEHILTTEKSQRVVTFLTREEVDYLDKLGKDALFSTGLKLSRAKLIAWLVEFAKKLNVSGSDIKSEHDFEYKLMEVLGHKLRVVSPHQPHVSRCHGHGDTKHTQEVYDEEDV